jgi:hypothetical protein
MTSLQKMGFCEGTYEACDAKDDGVVSIGDQSSKFTGLEGYQEAFMNLANLGGVPKAIDAQDFAKLADKKVLAEVIANDPAYKVIASRREPLQYNKKEVKAAELLPGIKPRNYKRIVYYSQMALGEIVDSSLVPDGIYGDDTLAAVMAFQKKLGIKPDHGRYLGPQTLGTLVMRCRYTAGSLVEILEDDIDFLKANGPFIIDSAGNGHQGVRNHIVMALKWLGYLGESVNSQSSKQKHAITKALSKNFDGATLVGPIVMGWIIERVKKLNVKPTSLPGA